MTRLTVALATLLVTITLPSITTAHGDHAHAETEHIEDWATRHMAEEHHINNLDPSSFFTLHDFDSDGFWEVDEIARTYGLEHASTNNIGEEQRKEAMDKVLSIFDPQHEHAGEGISAMQFVQGWQEGKRLPDFGFGPGHHGDDEYEYEIHHFEKYHDENTREEDLTHPEDIEHFRKHDQEDIALQMQAKLDQMPIVEANIPAKFRRN